MASRRAARGRRQRCGAAAVRADEGEGRAAQAAALLIPAVMVRVLLIVGLARRVPELEDTLRKVQCDMSNFRLNRST
eukprot:gene7075-biopygen7539